MKVTILKTEKALLTSIAKQKALAKDLDKLYHQNGVSALFQFGKAWNQTMLLNVIAGIGKAGRKKAFILWVEKHASLKYDRKDGKFRMPKDVDKRFSNYEAAMAEPFWDATEENPDKAPMTMEQVLQFVKARARKAAQEGLVDDLEMPRILREVSHAFTAGVKEGHEKAKKAA